MWKLDKFKDNKALIDEQGNSLSYSELNQESIKLFEIINKRCLVFLLCENSIGSVLGYVSFIKNRVVPVDERIII